MFSFSIITGVFLATAAKGLRAAEAILTRLVVDKNGKNMTDLAQATASNHRVSQEWHLLKPK